MATSNQFQSTRLGRQRTGSLNTGRLVRSARPSTRLNTGRLAGQSAPRTPAFDGLQLRAGSIQLARGSRGVDFRQIRRMLARSSALETLIQRKLEQGKVYAESITPDGPPIGRGVKWAFRTSYRQQRDGMPIGILRNSNRLWAIVEKGTGSVGDSGRPRPQGGYSPPHHVFARTLVYMSHID